MTLFNDLKDIIDIGSGSRTAKAKKNIIVLFVIHTFNFLTLLVIVPLSISYLGTNDYGIWLTLSSIFMWLANLDFGIGNGLRNKLAESFAKGDFIKAKTHLSTAYIIFAIGIGIFLLVYIIIHPFINWENILNIKHTNFPSLNGFVLIVFVFFAFQFLLRLLTSIIMADQKPAINGFITLCINILTLVTIYVFYKISILSLFTYGIVITIIPLIVLTIASYVLFKTKYKIISPSLKFVNYRDSNDLVVLSVQFFVLQVAGIIVYSTDNLIITHLYDPTQVTIYNVACKYFYFVVLVFNVFLTPFWSAFTEAYVKREFLWIQNSIKRLAQIWAISSFGILLMIIFSDFAYRIWVGEIIKIPFSLSIAMGIFIMINNWNNIFTFFINGSGKIRLQFYYAIIIAIINIPLSIILAKYFNIGITGVIIATDICLIFGSIIMPIQYRKIISGKATGLWNK